NDLENIPAFLFVALLFTLTGGSATGGWAYFGLYFAARLFHTIMYLAQKQPWRTVCFALGQITLLGLLAQLVLKVL
ncbi:MAG TPA: MAPEG family protein, partial [Pseudomonadota bacterium]|nr:MAPEG family protein [Pseudomonadota bacterium]